jgi:hypothetical protein
MAASSSRSAFIESSAPYRSSKGRQRTVQSVNRGSFNPA